MPYMDLHELIANSSSARQYFLSLPVELQLQLHGHPQQIHSAAQLHIQAGLLERHNHAVAISDSLGSFLQGS